MKKSNIILTILSIMLILVVIVYNDKITEKFVPYLENQPKVALPEKNKYYRNQNFKFVKQNDTFIPYGYQDLLDIIYSVLNNGWESFTFYCPVEYELCVSDIQKIASDDTLITYINNFVHPFNAFENIKIYHDGIGEITIFVEKLYSKNEIDFVNNEIDNIISRNINNDMDIKEKIRIIHDYIIDNTKYDTERDKKGINRYKSNTAYGVLKDGYGICGGYTDTMALFLNRIKVNNYAISTKDHVWNAVYLNDSWLHLDLTWDDPIGEDGTEYSLKKYFLISSDILYESATDNHDFDTSIYQEFK